MKNIMLALTLTLFSTHAFSATINLDIEGPMTFECTIPDHGGDCDVLSKLVSHDAERGYAIRVINVTKNTLPQPEIMLRNVVIQGNAQLDFSLDIDSETRENTLIRFEGSNRLRFEIYGRNGEFLGGAMRTIEVTIEWNY